jgi:uncharacterized membrane protein
MSSPASVKGHPIHPMLVGVPIGLWTFALVADLVYKLGLGDESWARTAFLCIGGGIVGALLAAVPGLFDLLSLSDPRAKRVGVLHMSVNLVAVAIFVVSFLMRWNGLPGDTGPIILSALGVAVLGVGGWLGGELVFRHGVAVDTSAPVESYPEGARTRPARG